MEPNANLARPAIWQATDDFCQDISVGFHRIILPMAVLNTFFTGGRAGQFAAQIAFQG
jgi:hypothetical protein